MRIKNIEVNSRSYIILGLLEDLSLNQRPDLAEFLSELTILFYNLLAKYIAVELMNWRQGSWLWTTLNVMH